MTESARSDLEEIVACWTDRGEPERGEEYAYDLPAEAIRQLSEPSTARSGRHLLHTEFPEAQELPVFKCSYRNLYFVKKSDNLSKCCASGTATATSRFKIERGRLPYCGPRQ